ncbi:DegT/DnrJ/EryC1/StrS family aminotransferase [Patescibacteria group bacterium]|nr:DegT/DnrJ/EryC1/StrS family aminotransferase [Patescibacteria group bacterium]
MIIITATVGNAITGGRSEILPKCDEEKKETKETCFCSGVGVSIQVYRAGKNRSCCDRTVAKETIMSKLAIRGGRPIIEGDLKLPDWPIYNEEDKEALIEVLESKRWCRLHGSKTDEFEKRFAEYQDAKYAIAVANGTVSLEIALKTLGVEIGDEVLVPAVSFIATASAVSELGAIPVFVDIDIETGCINPDAVEERISPRTKGIIVVHFGGYPADFDKILSRAKKHNLFVIEDAAHAHGSEWKGRKVGAIGDIGSFSFQESKALTSGEGGIILTNNEEYHEKARLIHNIGRILDKLDYIHYILSSNHRLSEFQSALLISQIKRLPEQTEIKHNNGVWLDEELSKIDGILPQRKDNRITKRGYCFYLFRYQREEFSNVPRDKFLEALNAEGIPGTKLYGMPLYKQPAFTKNALKKVLPAKVGEIPDYEHMNLANSEQFCFNESISFPHQILFLKRKDLQYIIDAILKIRDSIGELGRD